MEQRLKVGLPPELRSQLDAAAAKSGKSVADEIRSRVEWSFSLEPLDEPTRQLIEGIVGMAADLERECGAPWHSHRGTFAALDLAVVTRLSRLRPEGDAAFGPRPHRAWGSDIPADIGRWSEFTDWERRDWTPASRYAARLLMERSWQELQRRQQQREQEGGND
jgi:hypothetical protein